MTRFVNVFLLGCLMLVGGAAALFLTAWALAAAGGAISLVSSWRSVWPFFSRARFWQPGMSSRDRHGPRQIFSSARIAAWRSRCGAFTRLPTPPPPDHATTRRRIVVGKQPDRRHRPQGRRTRQGVQRTVPGFLIGGASGADRLGPAAGNAHSASEAELVVEHADVGHGGPFGKPYRAAFTRSAM